MKHLVINLILFWCLKVSIFIIHVKITQQQINEILKRIHEKADLIKSKQNTYDYKKSEEAKTVTSAIVATNPTTVYAQTTKVTKTYSKSKKLSHKSSSDKPPVVVHSPFIPDYMVWSNFSNTFINDTINSIQSRRSNNISVYYAMFAGRAELIKIHFQYTDILLKLGLVNEVHIWDFTNGNVGDADYLADFKRTTELPGYKLFTKPSSQYYRGDFTKPGQNISYKYLWYSFYEHYLTNKRYQPQDIFIKADDDVVFIDISSFHLFLNEIINCTGNNLHFPNIINNDAGFVIQSARIYDAAPELQKWWKYYTVNPFQMDFHSRFNDYYELLKLNISSVYAEPLTTWKHGSFILPEFAYDLHMSFLRDPGAYLKELHASNLTKLVPLNQRISINMYAGSFLVIRERFRSFLLEHCCDDEGFIGSVPTFFNTSHIIHTDFVISHFAFHPQYKDGALIALRSNYLELSKIIAAEYNARLTNITSI